MNVAVILAGGTGSRMGTALPKQFMPLNGKPVIEHSIDTFHAIADIDEIAVVVHPDYRNRFLEIAGSRQWTKLRHVIEGGAERYLSSLNAIAQYLDAPDDTNLIFHDAARPWVSEAIIQRVLAALPKHEAVGVAIPSTDTIWEVSVDFAATDFSTIPHFISRIPLRDKMFRAQTPQAFRLPLIRDAYQAALQDPDFHPTDDCSVVRRYVPGIKIHVVMGDEGNRKITYPEDI